MDQPTFETARGNDRWRIPTLTAAQVRSLPASIPLVYAARALGLGRDVAYAQARSGALAYRGMEVPVTLAGSRMLCAQADVLRALGLDEVPVRRGAASAGRVA